MPGGSGRGYHFISEWKTCPRKWFLHHIAGLESTELKPATITGTILHYLQERFYLKEYQNLDLRYGEEIRAECEKYRIAWFDDEEFDESYRKITDAFFIWRNTYGYSDSSKLELIGTEILMENALPNNVIVTCQLDSLFKDRESGGLVLKDTKTTTWSPEAAHKKVEVNDQVTMYTWHIQKKYGFVPVEMIPDIIYLKPKVPTCVRFGAIHRTPSDVEGYILGLCHDTDEIEKSVDQYFKNVAPPEYLFPRSAIICSEFGCEYESICRTRQDETTPPPLSGFVKNQPLGETEYVFRKNFVDNKPIEG